MNSWEESSVSAAVFLAGGLVRLSTVWHVVRYVTIPGCRRGRSETDCPAIVFRNVWFELAFSIYKASPHSTPNESHWSEKVLINVDRINLVEGTVFEQYDIRNSACFGILVGIWFSVGINFFHRVEFLENSVCVEISIAYSSLADSESDCLASNRG